MTSPSTNTVRFSIIVPTFRRADRLERLLLSLEPQLAGRSDRELIAVDDASGDPSYATLAHRFGSTMQLLTQPKNAGPSAARNAGFRASRGEFLVFTDDDCVATPYWLDWLDNILVENPDIDLIGGEARPLPHEHGMTVTRWVPDGFLRLRTWSCRNVVTLAAVASLPFDEAGSSASAGFARRCAGRKIAI
ncbi:MAG: glycosyltransferase family A protein [Dongiaceae bacterium]